MRTIVGTADDAPADAGPREPSRYDANDDADAGQPRRNAADAQPGGLPAVSVEVSPHLPPVYAFVVSPFS